MGDTTKLYYYNGTKVPFDSLPPDVKDLYKQTEPLPPYDEEKDPTTAYAPFVFLVVMVIGFLLLKKAWKSPGTTIIGSWNDRQPVDGWGPFAVERYSSTEERFRDLTKGYLVYYGRDIILPGEQYEKILSKRCPYYTRLSPDMKERFVRRLKGFLNEKTFLIRSNDPFMDMPVLISAAAVQLTFGLDDYLLPHYQYIRIFPEEYIATGTLHVVAGHVYGNTITLAWNQFLQGNEEYTDGVNVGLHEMAHALYFQHVHADVIKSRDFIANFNQVMAEGKEMYELKHQTPEQLFSQNAYTNLQEFWAESIEVFFERPSDLKRVNPDLYDSLRCILNQDPVNTLYPVVTG